MRSLASVGVPLEEVALRGVGETLPCVGAVASRLVGEEEIESIGGRCSIETLGLEAELQGSTS